MAPDLCGARGFIGCKQEQTAYAIIFDMYTEKMYSVLAMINTVDISKVEKALEKLPRHIVENFRAWIRIIKLEGLERSRLVKGYHDEPLKGKRRGQRSIRLSRAYRAIYSLKEGRIQMVIVEEVNKHEYR